MALLTVAKRKAYFKALGLGEYNKATILKLQKQYFTRKKDQDGAYGPDTDKLLRHVYNVKKHTTTFKPEEFRCGCGRKYCTGYPTWMKGTELDNLQAIRTKYGKPMQITSGMRCTKFNNSLRGSSKTSKHLTGYAADFYIAGVTDTVARRKSLIAYAKTLPNFNWSYGNGWCSSNYKISAPNMGNAVHLDSKKKTTTAVTTTAAASAAKTTESLQAWFDAMKTQYKWSKKQKYKWVKPTVKSSKTKGTCISFVAVSLQRLGLIKSGQYFYFHPDTNKITGTAASTVKKGVHFSLSYPNKTIAKLGSSIQKGDIVGYDNPSYHTMVYMGKNKSGQPIFNTMGSKRGLGITYPYYAKRKVNMLVRIKKI